MLKAKIMEIRKIKEHYEEIYGITIDDKYVPFDYEFIQEITLFNEIFSTSK